MPKQHIDGGDAILVGNGLIAYNCPHAAKCANYTPFHSPPCEGLFSTLNNPNVPPDLRFALINGNLCLTEMQTADDNTTDATKPVCFSAEPNFMRIRKVGLPQSLTRNDEGALRLIGTIQETCNINELEYKVEKKWRKTK